MLEALLNWLSSIWHDFKPIIFIKQYEEAVLYRMGTYRKSLSPGWYLRIPFIDEYHEHYAKDDTIKLPSQKLITRDGKRITIVGTVLYHIADINLFMNTVNNPEQAISDMAEIVMARNVVNAEFKDCNTETLMNEIEKDLRRECKKWGAHIAEFAITSVTESRSFNIFKEEPAHL